MSVINTPVGKQLRTKGGRIAGVVACLPTRQISNDYFAEQFGVDAVKEVVKMIGVEHRYWVDEGVSTADICYQAAERLLSGLGWKRESIDAFIFVSQTPDYRLPATACSLHGRLGLQPSCLAFDINLGCSAYPYALWLGLNMIQTGAVKRVLLAVGDTSSKVINPSDRSTAILFGDAGTVTALEYCENCLNDTFFMLGTDGKGSHNLIIPRGAFKDYSLSNDSRLEDKDPNCLYMDGSEIFTFTMQVVPPLILSTIEFSGCNADEFDAFLFHQANLFMLKHLAKKAKLPMDRVPININKFGNTSSASIPLLMTDSLAPLLQERSTSLAMFSFGVGYSWASAALTVGPLDVVEMIDFKL
ncbi:ketoacyl-ACP synthase III [Nostoc sphaeroides]|uniref:FabH, 3-oxoacyl-[acyl-carrier-protein] synthase III n=1 Tax=Nostoc sphaeroides CCNUC1 TaxID=2653204 RepID=A0A5P8VTD6_9NOSO|nr:ketoacyl-ACP synthase III [Nostoc sphaeroides]QFS43159.1 fabH, 3-oxoacyl-[acyl-carrier-protein] synthase III [Nostoc sphaeroides CCNUC1]